MYCPNGPVDATACSDPGPHPARVRIDRIGVAHALCPTRGAAAPSNLTLRNFPSEASPILFDFLNAAEPRVMRGTAGLGLSPFPSLLLELLEAAMGTAMRAGSICGPKFFECLRYMRNMMRHVGTITNCRPLRPGG